MKIGLKQYGNTYGLPQSVHNEWTAVRRNRWKIVIIRIIKGKIKWMQKNRVSVGFLTLYEAPAGMWFKIRLSNSSK